MHYCDTVHFIHSHMDDKMQDAADTFRISTCCSLARIKVTETTKSSRISADENSARIRRKSIEKREKREREGGCGDRREIHQSRKEKMIR